MSYIYIYISTGRTIKFFGCNILYKHMSNILTHRAIVIKAKYFISKVNVSLFSSSGFLLLS